MKFYDRTWLPTAIVERMRRVAAYGTFDGASRTAAYLQHCRGLDQSTGAILLFTRDVGHHTSGWLKNPDYERCYHLSLSFVDPITGESRPYDERQADTWARRFFGDDLRFAWIEPPAYRQGKERGVHHYRVFCDEGWQAIHPRGEVYSTELTEAGWKSFSELQADRARALTSGLEAES